MARGARRGRRARRLAVAGHRQPRQDRPGPDPARAERGRRGDGRRRRRLLDDAAQGEPGRRRGAGDAGAAERRHARHAAPGAGARRRSATGVAMGLEWFALPQMCAAAGGATRLALGAGRGAGGAPRPDRRDLRGRPRPDAGRGGGLRARRAGCRGPRRRRWSPRRSGRSATAPSPRRWHGGRPTSTGPRCSIRAGSPATLRRSPTGSAPPWRRGGVGRHRLTAQPPPPRPCRESGRVKAGEAAAEGRSALTPARLQNHTGKGA